MKSRSKPVIVITSKGSTVYKSINDAAQGLGITKQRIIRALKSDYGEIQNTRPVICVDYFLDPDPDESL